jgi:large subunit ribosomal protein L28
MLIGTMCKAGAGKGYRFALKQTCHAATFVAAEDREKEIREEEAMSAGRCDICERKPMYGNNVPFSQHRTRRRFVLNVQRRRIEVNGSPRMVNICTRCLRTMSKLPKVR